jgi:hypothetical protein
MMHLRCTLAGACSFGILATAIACDDVSGPKGCDDIASLVIDTTVALIAKDGRPRLLTAQAKDAQGTTIERPLAWSSLSPDIASVEESGRITAVKTGVARVTVAGCRARDSVDVIVLSEYQMKEQATDLDTVTLVDINNAGSILGKSGTSAFLGHWRPARLHSGRNQQLRSGGLHDDIASGTGVI